MGRFVAKGILFVVSLAILLLGIEALLTSTTSWRRFEDPHERILWDGAYDGTRIVLLGGSEFASIYVRSQSDRLWARLEAYSGEPVFPGALNGARLPDVVAAAVHVSQEWPPGTTVFISLAPTRFVASRAEEPAVGNYAHVYFRQYGIDGTSDRPLRRLGGQVNRRLLRPFYASRTRSVLSNLIDRPGHPGWMRHRVWRDERVAKERFELFERSVIMGTQPHRLESLERVLRPLEEAGLRPVCVLTPLNEELVRTFASVHPPSEILQHLRRTAAAVKLHLSERRRAVIDLTDVVPSSCFFDLVHLNTCGDDLMAKRLAEWLREHPQD
jgi:hypothetical protein